METNTDKSKISVHGNDEAKICMKEGRLKEVNKLKYLGLCLHMTTIRQTSVLGS